MENFDHILLFKTNLKEGDRYLLQEVFLKEGIEEWNIDLDDEDRVLRIVSRSLNHAYIIRLITGYGYRCAILA